MATLSRTKNGAWRVGWWEVPPHAPEGARKEKRVLHLGQVTKGAANEIRSRLEELIDSRSVGVEPPAAALRWLASIPAGRFREALERHGFRAADHERRTRAVPTLAAWIAEFIENRSSSWREGATTLPNYRQTEKWAIRHFGDRRLLTDIRPADVSRWREWMRTPEGERKALGAVSAAKHTKRFRGILAAAVDAGFLAKNPAAGEVCPAEVSRRKVYIPLGEFEQVLAECPSDEWRAALILARIAGLRVPSELHSLEWEGVSWSAGTLRVSSPKGERHGKSLRIVPLFPQLRGALERLWESAPAGARWILPTFRQRGAAANLRQGLQRFATRAGIVPWPEPFRSMRSSAATDLQDIFPRHVVVSWLGNTSEVAERHYLRTTAEHVQRALTLNCAPPSAPFLKKQAPQG